MKQQNANIFKAKKKLEERKKKIIYQFDGNRSVRALIERAEHERIRRVCLETKHQVILLPIDWTLVVESKHSMLEFIAFALFYFGFG